MKRIVTARYTQGRHRVLGQAANQDIRAGNGTHYYLRRLKWLEWVPTSDGKWPTHERITEAGRLTLQRWDHEYGTDARHPNGR